MGGNAGTTLGEQRRIVFEFVATFWGVFLANGVYLPTANKLKRMTAEETAYMELIVAGVLELQAGTSPRVMEGMLQSYIKSSDAEKAA